MKVSISKFYHEVTGRKTGNRGSCTAALERWGVPFDSLNGKAKGDAVDVVHLEPAKKIWAAEIEQHKVRAQRKPKAQKLVEDGDLLELLVRLDDNVTRIAAIVAAIALHLKVKE